MESVTEARRAKFEAWADGCDLTRDGDGYLNYWAGAAWEAYNAALDSLVIELPKSCAYESLDSSMVFVQLTYELGSKTKDPVDLVRLPDVRQAIEKAGVRTK
jgi:hypothetical protein